MQPRQSLQTPPKTHTPFLSKKPNNNPSCRGGGIWFNAQACKSPRENRALGKRKCPVNGTCQHPMLAKTRESYSKSVAERPFGFKSQPRRKPLSFFLSKKKERPLGSKKEKTFGFLSERSERNPRKGKIPTSANPFPVCKSIYFLYSYRYVWITAENVMYCVS
jgi:hypothetical protein